ncbi:MAG: hypothetical protein JWR19_2852 [Pedosphaera sp.]|nr:hypothetical protein [Pedosphaera sp.]
MPRADLSAAAKALAKGEALGREQVRVEGRQTLVLFVFTLRYVFQVTRHRFFLTLAAGFWYGSAVQIDTLEGLTRVLQASISPVALVSGIGLLILSQTNRFSRVTERLRELAQERQELPEKFHGLSRQIVIFNQRAHLLRSAIGASLICALLASTMVLVIFAIAALDLHLHLLVLSLFALSLLSLIISLILFICDMHLSLKAVEHMLQDYEAPYSMKPDAQMTSAPAGRQINQAKG